MNTTQHLLVLLAEECAEVQQVVAKALRFGLDDVWPSEIKNPEKLTCEQRLRLEVNDLFAVIELLSERGVDLDRSPACVAAKRARMAEYMAYAEEKGELE